MGTGSLLTMTTRLFLRNENEKMILQMIYIFSEMERHECFGYRLFNCLFICIINCRRCGASAHEAFYAFGKTAVY